MLHLERLDDSDHMKNYFFGLCQCHRKHFVWNPYMLHIFSRWGEANLTFNTPISETAPLVLCVLLKLN